MLVISVVIVIRIFQTSDFEEREMAYYKWCENGENIKSTKFEKCCQMFEKPKEIKSNNQICMSITGFCELPAFGNQLLFWKEEEPS